jgi:hypothetical protein
MTYHPGETQEMSFLISLCLTITADSSAFWSKRNVFDASWQNFQATWDLKMKSISEYSFQQMVGEKNIYIYIYIYCILIYCMSCLGQWKFFCKVVFLTWVPKDDQLQFVIIENPKWCGGTFLASFAKSLKNVTQPPTHSHHCWLQTIT